MKNIKWILIVTAFFALGACSKDKASEQTFPNLQNELFERNEAAVLDTDGMPIVGAEVQIGHHRTTTNSAGIFKVPTTWKSPLPVTIFKNGKIKTTYLEQIPMGQTYRIKTRTPAQRIEVKGAISGFGNLPKDGFIDFGLAIANFDPQTALNFNISQIISSESDVVSIMGQKLDIPTNVFVPNQKESYGFIPITIEKAFYRLFYDFPGTYTAQATLGRFNFKAVADKLKGGKSFFEVVNDFELNSIGTAQFMISKPNETLNIAANKTKLSPTVEFTTALPSEGLMFGLTMVETNGKLQPADIKVRENKKQMLMLPAGTSQAKVLLVHADKVEKTKGVASLSDSMTTALVDSKTLHAGVLLDRVAPPTLIDNGIEFDVPSVKQGVDVFATYAALSNVSEVRVNNIMVETSDVTWEIYAPGWLERIELSGIANVSSQQRWQVGFYGIDSNKDAEFTDAQSLNQATHAVHNAVHF